MHAKIGTGERQGGCDDSREATMPLDIHREIEEVRSDVAALRAEVASVLAKSNSVSARVWDFATKVAVPVSIVTFGFMFGDRENRVTNDAEHEKRISVMEKSAFTRENALELKDAIISRENPQLTLLINEMRNMSIQFAERLTRVETLIQSQGNSK